MFSKNRLFSKSSGSIRPMDQANNHKRMANIDNSKVLKYKKSKTRWYTCCHFKIVCIKVNFEGEEGVKKICEPTDRKS